MDSEQLFTLIPNLWLAPKWRNSLEPTFLMPVTQGHLWVNPPIPIKIGRQPVEETTTWTRHNFSSWFRICNALQSEEMHLKGSFMVLPRNGWLHVKPESTNLLMSQLAWNIVGTQALTDMHICPGFSTHQFAPKLVQLGADPPFATMLNKKSEPYERTVIVTCVPTMFLHSWNTNFCQNVACVQVLHVWTYGA